MSLFTAVFPDAWSQFNEAQLQRLARRHHPKLSDFLVRTATREDLVNLIEAARLEEKRA